MKDAKFRYFVMRVHILDHPKWGLKVKHKMDLLFYQAKMETYDAGLAKLNEAFESIASYRREVSNLVPKHQMAQAVVKEHVEFVEVHRGEYISVNNILLYMKSISF